jgi:hypothetical protein
MEALAILQLVRDAEFTGIIINPAGPWAGVPKQDIERILDGVW